MNSFLFSISQAEIVIVSIWCFFTIALIREIKEKIFNDYHQMLNSSLTVFLLISSQLVLLFFLPPYRTVIVTYFFLCLVGINLYPFIAPSFLRFKHSYFVMLPITGLAILSLVGAYFIGFSIQISFVVPTLLALSLISSLLLFKFQRERVLSLFKQLRKDHRSLLIIYSCIITPIILFLILPVILSDHETSTYRIGPDIASYAKISQFFLDGGTWQEAIKRSGEFAGMTPGDINRYADATMTWPEMFYFRWGLTAYQTSISFVTFTKHSYETAFVSLAVPYLLLCALVFIWLRKQISLGIPASILGAIAFAFNANLINLWYEGFYGNSFALVFFVSVLYIFIHHRNNENISRNDFLRSVLFSSTLIAASLSSYAEAVVFVLPVFIVFVFVADLFYNKRIKWSPYLALLASGIIGLLLVLPCRFLEEWLMLAFKQLTEEGGNGYTQPLWSLPNEILGLQNIYLNITGPTAGRLQHRSLTDLFVTILFSGFILYSFLLFLKKNRRAGNALYIGSIGMTALAACYVAYKTPGNNYTFMKMYVFHLPFFFVAFWGSVGGFISYQFPKYLRRVSSWVFFFFFIPIIVSGLIYVVQYNDQSLSIHKYLFTLHDDAHQLNFKNAILYAPYLVTPYDRIMYPAVLHVPWIVPVLWKDKGYFNKFPNHKVYIFIEKKPGQIYSYGDKSIIFENQWCIIFDSGKTVRESLNGEHTNIDFDVLLNESKRELTAKIIEHNEAAGLPSDFDPFNYLRLNPMLIEYWRSLGITERNQLLLERAERHYKLFGARDSLRYK